MNLCFKLHIQRNFSSLGHYIHENPLYLHLKVGNEYWQYDDDQLLRICAVCESSYTCLIHSNQLWNQVVFEEMMRLPSDDDEIHEFPWEIYKIYYLKTKEDPKSFLNASIYDESLNDYVFERTNYKYNSSICRVNEVCNENRVYIYLVDKNTISSLPINTFKKNNKDFCNYYFTSDFGYSSYASNLFAGFSKNVFVSFDEKLIDAAIDADTRIDRENNVAINLPEGVVQGNYLLSMNNGLRFSTNLSKLKTGRKANNISEIVVSSGLIKTLGIKGQILGKTLEFTGEIEEIYNLDGTIEKHYNRTKLVVVGIVEEEDNYLYHNQDWTIEFFRDKLGVSSFYLIPRSIVMEFESQDAAKEAYGNLQTILPGYNIESPTEELKSNINTTLDYASTILKVFSLLASIISILLLSTILMLTIIESRDDIRLFSLLGIRKEEIDSFFVVQSVLQGLIAFVISSLELIIFDFAMSSVIGNMLRTGLKFSINIKPFLLIFLASTIVPIVISCLMLIFLNNSTKTMSKIKKNQ